MRKPSIRFVLEPLGQIERLARAVSSPASYLKGRIGPRPVIPENILCFVVRRADDLAKRPLRPYDQHHRFVLIVSLRGSGQVCIDAKSFSLRPGQAQLVFPFQFHSYLSLHPRDICWVFITFELEEGEAKLERLRSARSRQLGPEELALLSEFLRGWTGKGALQLLQLRLAALLTRLDALKSVRSRKARAPLEQADAELLLRINRQALVRKSGRLKELAAALGFSESHLRRRFRRAIGVSLGHHLRELRLNRACGLLYGSSLSVGEIARECGFDSIYAFSRAFKRDLGLAPRAYRSGRNG